MVSEKSSIGEISSKISWRPDLLGDVLALAARRSTTASHFSLPISQSKASVWSERSWGTSMGSWILLNEMRRGLVPEVLRAARGVLRRIALDRVDAHH